MGSLPPSVEESCDVEDAAADVGDLLYRDIFHASAVSAWHLDTKGLIPLFTKLQEHGVSDLAAYSRDDPGFARLAQDAMRVIDINDETLRLFGASDRSEIVGMPIGRFWIEGRSDTFIDCIDVTFSGRSTFRGETWLRTLDGREIYVLFTKAESPRLRGAGEALLSIVDLTEQHLAQAALEEARAGFAHASRHALLGEVTASIAHEVNQPMTAIMTYGAAGLRWLKHADPDVSEVREALSCMIEAAGRASDVAARIQTMAMPAVIDRRWISLNDLVIEATKLLGPNLAELDVAQASSLQPGLPPIYADATQLKQVIINLALNAGQAMEGSPLRLLSIRTAAAGADHVRLDLEDSGRGIDPVDHDRLFESFFTTKASGMGLGLAVCRAIIEAHGGTITIQGRSEGGACATLTMPTAQAVGI